MEIRHYEPGDEPAQAAIYNAAAGLLPAFKPATVEEIARRYRSTDLDPSTKFYAVEGGQVVGYALFSPSGRISFPWCSPGFEAARPALLDSVLSALRRRGVGAAWAAYRADWRPVLEFFARQGFTESRRMINYVAELASLPRASLPHGWRIESVDRANVPELLELGGDLFRDESAEILEEFFWENPSLDPGSLFALRRADDDRLLGAGLAVARAGYADPTKLDAAMPCFRLGALGTETERHKRVNGLVSCVFESEPAGTSLLAEAARRLEAAGLTHAAAQAPSDQPALCAFYDRHFQRQDEFPILTRPLAQ